MLISCAEKAKRSTAIRYKIEKAEAVAVEPIELVQTPTRLTPSHVALQHRQPTSNIVLFLLRNTEHLYSRAKRDLIETCGRTIDKTSNVSNSTLSGIYDPLLSRVTQETNATTTSLRSWLNLSIAISLIPMLGAFGGTKLSVTLSIIVWPLSLYLASILYSELQYFQHSQLIITKAKELGEKIELFLPKIRSALQLIQEVGLVSRGYRITAQLSPIARLEQNAKNRRCQVIREETCAALSSVQSALQQLLKDAKHVSFPTDALNQQLVTLSSEQDTSISNLRYLFQIVQISLAQYSDITIVHKLNIIRETSDEWKTSEEPTLAVLKTVSSELGTLASVIGLSESQISKALSYQDSWIRLGGDEASSKGKNATAVGTRASLLDALNSLQSSLQTQSARIALCKDHLHKFGSEGEESTLNELLQTFSKFQSEMDVQTPSYFSTVSHLLNRLTREAQQEDGATSHAAGSTVELKTHGNFELDSASAAGFDTLDNTINTSNSSGEVSDGAAREKVYEAETGDEVEEEIKPSQLSREERIKLARQAREETRKKEEEVFARLNFVMELKDVLQQRVPETQLGAPSQLISQSPSM